MAFGAVFFNFQCLAFYQVSRKARLEKNKSENGGSEKQQMIEQSVIDLVLESTDIVALIGDYVRLQKKGRNYVGKCPFHQESQPSFTVSPDKRIFYCFGCHVGGNAFRFLMLYDNLSFMQALYRLAERAGIRLDRQENRENSQDSKLFEVNAWAAGFYHQILIQSSKAQTARHYLQQRGLDTEIIERFQLGFAPDGWGNLLKTRQFVPELLLAAGLISQSSKGHFYDRFRNRIMFPVKNSSGKVVGFGGRILADGEPKYLNTPETVCFIKNRLLFGLDLAKDSIRRQNQAVLMEGYMDVVTAHQFGVTNAVASLGTSFTLGQARLLSRYTSRVLLAFDSDTAGQVAAFKGLDLLQAADLESGVITVPEGKDPDEFLRKFGLEAWNNLKPDLLLEYKLKVYFKQKLDRLEILEKILPNLAALGGGAKLEESLKLVASRLSLTGQAVQEELLRYLKKSRNNWHKTDIKPDNTIPKALTSMEKAEQKLLHILLHDPESCSVVQKQLGRNFWSRTEYQEIWEKVISAANPAASLNYLSPQAAVLTQELWLKPLDQHLTKIRQDCINILQKELANRQKVQLLQDLAAAEKNGDQESIRLLLQQIQNLFCSRGGVPQ